VLKNLKRLNWRDLETTHTTYKLINRNKQYPKETWPQEACKGRHAH